MRLIDADKLIEVLRKNSIFRTVTNAEDKSVIKIIEEQPIAYDLDKVVEQLKNKKISAFMTFANTGNEYLDMVYEDIGNYIDEAIDIVKDGGLNE